MSRDYWRGGNMLYPVPAVMVSCAKTGEKPNIITIAWTGTVCSDPAMVYISVRPSRYSHGIIRDTGEFVINLVNRKLLRATDWCGVKSGRDVDKFKEMHLTVQESRKIKAPGILESPVNIECKVRQVLELGSHDMFVAEVMSVTVDDAYMDKNGRFDLNAADLIAYSHGEYFTLGEKVGKFGYSVARKPSKEKGVAAGKITKRKGTKGSKSTRIKK